jgi:hypothetical protein
MPAFALLRHTLLDGTWHNDWLIEQPAPADPLHPLLCFRTQSRPDRDTRFSARQVPDHRRVYLTYEGPLSQDRGHVQRIAAGLATILSQTPISLEVELLISGQRRCIQGLYAPHGTWTFSATIHNAGE